LRFGVNFPVLSNLPADIARSKGQPASSRPRSVTRLMPSCSAHAANGLRSPLNSMIRLNLAFRFCCFCVAHWQLVRQ
jgi:hypothetical protein